MSSSDNWEIVASKGSTVIIKNSQVWLLLEDWFEDIEVLVQLYISTILWSALEF